MSKNERGAVRWNARGHVEAIDLDGQDIRLQGSSLVKEFACRIYSNERGVAHLSVEQARAFRDWLDGQVHTAESLEGDE